MADIFISYKSSDRPRAETLKGWFQQAGWSVWIDRGIAAGEDWQEQIVRQLEAAGVIVVIWSAEARRSDWVRREAELAHRTGRLVQIHATGLPLLPPFDQVQAIRMQSWAGESSHSERMHLLKAVAERLGCGVPGQLSRGREEEVAADYRLDVAEALGLAMYYCARQVERTRLRRERGPRLEDFQEVRESFTAMLELLNQSATASDDDREGVLHGMTSDFLEQLLLLAPDPNAVG